MYLELNGEDILAIYATEEKPGLVEIAGDASDYRNTDLSDYIYQNGQITAR